MTIEKKDRVTVFVQQFGREVFVGRDGAVVHDIGEEKKGVLIWCDTHYLLPDHIDPFVKD